MFHPWHCSDNFNWPNNQCFQSQKQCQWRSNIINLKEIIPHVTVEYTQSLIMAWYNNKHSTYIKLKISILMYLIFTVTIIRMQFFQ